MQTAQSRGKRGGRLCKETVATLVTQLCSPQQEIWAVHAHGHLGPLLALYSMYVHRFFESLELTPSAS